MSKGHLILIVTVVPIHVAVVETHIFREYIPNLPIKLLLHDCRNHDKNYMNEE